LFGIFYLLKNFPSDKQKTQFSVYKLVFCLSRYKEGLCAGYYCGSKLNVSINGKQIEDLWQEWNARTREVEQLKRDNDRMRAQLKECGEIIRRLKEENESFKGRI
jgi:hypothetical protein